MPRTIPAAFSSAAAGGSGRIYLLHELSSLDTPLYISSGDDGLSFNGNTFRGWQAKLAGEIGAEIDWRGGLSTESTHQIAIIQEHDSHTGTTSDNTFDILKDLAVTSSATAGPIIQYYSSWLASGATSPGATYLVFDDGTPVLAESVQISGFVTQDLEVADNGEAIIDLAGLRDGHLGRRFLNRLGEEPSTEPENWDRTGATRDELAAGEGEPVPITYGVNTFASGLFVHDTPTQDTTKQAGLIICYLDARYRGDDTQGPSLFIWDEQTGQKAYCQNIVTSIAIGSQYVMLTTGFPEIINNAGNEGAFVSFSDPTKLDGVTPWLASEGALAIQWPQMKLTTEFSFSGFTTHWALGEGATHGVPNPIAGPAAVTSNLTLGSPSVRNGYSWKLPEISRPGELIRAIIEAKLTQTSSQAIKAGFRRDGNAGTGYATRNISNTADFTHTGNYDSMTLSHNKIYIYKHTQNGFITTRGSDLSQGSINLGLSTHTGTFTQSFYGATMDLYTAVDWNDYPNRVYAEIDGVIDESPAFYTGVANTVLENPVDIFYHFMRDVLEESGKIEHIARASSRSDIATEGLKFAFQLTDADGTGEAFLERLAHQSMCWLAQGDDGTERLVYRPGQVVDTGHSEAPLGSSVIIKGSMKMSLTSREDVYSGVHLSYSANAATGGFDKEYRMARESSTFADNMPAGTANDEIRVYLENISDESDKILLFDADLIQDDSTAEKLTRWLAQQGARRRQILEFDLTLEEGINWELGDVVAIDHPKVRKYSSGSALTIAHTTGVCTKTIGDAGGREHYGDILFVEDAGPNAGSYRIDSFGSGDFVLSSGHTLTTQAGVPEPFRVCPAFTVLKNALRFNEKLGPYFRMKVVEYPILRPGATAI